MGGLLKPSQQSRFAGSLGFLLLICLQKQAFDTASKQKPRHYYDRVCAEEEIRTPTPGYGRYHLKVVRLPISPPPRSNCKCTKKESRVMPGTLININLNEDYKEAITSFAERT